MKWKSRPELFVGNFKVNHEKDEYEPFILAGIMNAACMFAEIEAMKAENKQRELEGKSPAYSDIDFTRVRREWQY